MQAFEKASGKKVNTKLVARRPGDAEAVWAATQTADKVLGWTAKLGVKEMCEDQWKWASQYPKVGHASLRSIAVCFARLCWAKTMGASLSHAMTCARRDLNYSEASIAITKLSDTNST